MQDIIGGMETRKKWYPLDIYGNEQLRGKLMIVSVSE
jgi:hypothetical protein